MDSEEDVAAAAIVIAIICKRREKRERKRNRSIWVKPWLQRRNELGVDNTLLMEFRFEDEDEYKKFLRMTPEVFYELLTLIQGDIQKTSKKSLILSL